MKNIKPKCFFKVFIIVIISISNSCYVSIVQGAPLLPPEVVIGLEIINTANGLRENPGENIVRFKSIDLKLDKVLQNQETLMKGFVQVQKSINELGNNIPEFFKNDDFNDLHRSVDGLMLDIDDFIKRPTKIKDKMIEYKNNFDKTDRLSTELLSLLRNTDLVKVGLSSSLKSVLMIKHLSSLTFQLLNLEQLISKDNRWSSQREHNFRELINKLKKSADLYKNKHIKNKYNYEHSKYNEYRLKIASTLWGAVYFRQIEKSAKNHFGLTTVWFTKSVPQKRLSVRYIMWRVGFSFGYKSYFNNPFSDEVLLDVNDNQWRVFKTRISNKPIPLLGFTADMPDAGNSIPVVNVLRERVHPIPKNSQMRHTPNIEKGWKYITPNPRVYNHHFSGVKEIYYIDRETNMDLVQKEFSILDETMRLMSYRGTNIKALGQMNGLNNMYIDGLKELSDTFERTVDEFSNSMGLSR